MTDAFGYAPAGPVSSVVGVQVAEAKHADTLEPAVLVRIRLDESEAFVLQPDGRLTVALGLEMAEDLAAELVRWAPRAREKSL